MTRATLGLALLVLGAGALAAAAPTPAKGCASVAPPGVTVRAVSEEAIIVWDAAKGVEHFIRRTAFETDATDVGFLVPSPTQPELAEVSSEVFGEIAAATEAQTIIRRELELQLACCCLAPMASRGAAGGAVAGMPSVNVLSIEQVAGYEAAVLKADDAGALARWLDVHGYARPPALEAWLEAYVRQGWIITAFKLGRSGGQVATGTVRMSFATRRPFFPYREPEGQSEGARPLRLWLVGAKRYHVAGSRDEWDEGIWASAESARRGVGYSGALPGLADLLAEVVPAGTLSDEPRLTVVLDDAWGRPANDELWIIEPSDQSDHVPVEVEKVWVPVDLIAGFVGLILAIVAGVWVLRRRRRAPPSAPAKTFD